MASTRPLIVELEQTHKCVTLEISDKVKDVVIKWIATIGQDEKTISNVFEIPSDSAERIINLLKNHEDVLDVTVLQTSENITQIVVRERKEIATAPFLAEANVAWAPPTYSEKGINKFTMIAPSFENLKKFIELVSEHGFDLQIKSKRYLDTDKTKSLDVFRTTGFSKLKLASELLTDRQMEVFDLACRHGYYEEPKKISIEELAQKLDISPSTCSELLRKAERKLLPILSDVLRLMR